MSLAFGITVPLARTISFCHGSFSASVPNTKIGTFARGNILDSVLTETLTNNPRGRGWFGRTQKELYLRIDSSLLVIDKVSKAADNSSKKVSCTEQRERGVYLINTMFDKIGM